MPAPTPAWAPSRSERIDGRRSGTELGAFFADLRADVVADQDALKELLHRLGGDQSAAKKAAAWFAEKLTRVKLALEGPARTELALFESFEVLGLGILGKRALWRALKVVRTTLPADADVDLDRLERRAEEQFARVEERRLHAARAALSGS